MKIREGFVDLSLADLETVEQLHPHTPPRPHIEYFFERAAYDIWDQEEDLRGMILPPLAGTDKIRIHLLTVRIAAKNIIRQNEAETGQPWELEVPGMNNSQLIMLYRGLTRVRSSYIEDLEDPMGFYLDIMDVPDDDNEGWKSPEAHFAFNDEYVRGMLEGMEPQVANMTLMCNEIAEWLRKQTPNVGLN
jgi:hypothetical protein